MPDVIQAAPPTRIPVRSTDSATFPVRRVYCVGRNFADHAREMGATAPSSRADRGTPVFFCKPADAIVPGGVVPYPPGTSELHHEVELVVALGADAPPGELDRAQAEALVWGYGIGLDLTRRDLQAAAKAKGLPWDVAKAFDCSAPMSELVPAADMPLLEGLGLALEVNGEVRQQGRFADLIWDVPDILVELSRLFALRAGDVVFMGTPAGVGPLQPGDEYIARLGEVIELRGRIGHPATPHPPTPGGTP